MIRFADVAPAAKPKNTAPPPEVKRAVASETPGVSKAAKAPRQPKKRPAKTPA